MGLAIDGYLPPMALTNVRYLLSDRPDGMPTADAWSRDTEEVDEAVPEGHLLVEQHYCSLDPAMRGWMRNVRSYIPPVELGAVMRAGSVGKVVASRHPKFDVGQTVVGMGGIQQYVVTDGKGWVATPLPDALMPKALGLFGMTGFTAYFGLLDVGKPEAGQTVLVSGGAGAVGSVVGQIAKLKGCRVVGIAGGAAKCAYMTDELGFDAAVDYRAPGTFKAIRKACPDGVDVYFDNVGGEILDYALACLAPHARVVICGAISQYNEQQLRGPSNYLSLLVNRATMQGFVVFDYAKRYREAAAQFQEWMAAGKIQGREEVVSGIDNFYEAFARLFSGDKLGKMVLDVRAR